MIGNWIDELRAQGVDEQSCHHIREIRPGVLLTACQPFAAISINAADGGSPAHPKVLYTGAAAKFVHSARWPRQGADKFVLIGGEENFTGRCERNNSEFSVYSAEKVLAGQSKTFEGPLAQVPPAGNGVYADGKPVAGALGCSVHWFQAHPTFRDSGLVALSEYEDGVRFMQIGSDGSIEEQGYFLSLGSSSSSAKWAGKDDVLYSIDYQRGIDILRYRGEHYVPGAPPESRPLPGDERRDAADRAQRRASGAAHGARAALEGRRLVAGPLLPGCTAHLTRGLRRRRARERRRRGRPAPVPCGARRLRDARHHPRTVVGPPGTRHVRRT